MQGSTNDPATAARPRRSVTRGWIRLLRRARRVLSGGQLPGRILNHSVEGIVTFDREFQVRQLNPAAAALFGVDIDDGPLDIRGLIGLDRTHLLDGEMAPLADTGGSVDAWGRRGDGHIFPIELTVLTVRTRGRRRRVVFVRDQTQQRASQRRIEYQATHDLLTNLPNRYRIEQLLGSALRNGQPTQRRVGFLVLDLWNFQRINESLGYAAADDLLRKAARRIELAVGERASLARLGGDEFAILVPNASGDAMPRLCARLAAEFEKPFDVGGVSMQVTAAVGYCIPNEEDVSPEQVMRRADIALNRAKRERRWAIEYRETPQASGLRSLRLLSELQKALREPQRHGLRLVYQPLVATDGDHIEAVESLMRWSHPELGEISPGEFIPLAEDSGLIRPLTQWTISTALDQLMRWHRYGLRIRIAINFSAQLVGDEDLVPQLVQQLRHAGVAPEYLVLELTESMLLQNLDQTLATIKTLRKVGIGISIDDFGTGYSSLAYLTQLPASELKIDRSFVSRIHEDEKTRAIVRATVQMANELGMRTVAEGIESQKGWLMLKKMGVDVGQGYLLARPMESDELIQWVAQFQWRAEQQAPNRLDAPERVGT